MNSQLKGQYTQKALQDFILQIFEFETRFSMPTQIPIPVTTILTPAVKKKLYTVYIYNSTQLDLLWNSVEHKKKQL